MAVESLIETSIKQSFDKIEDQIVVDAISSRMNKVHDFDGQIYEADTHTASDVPTHNIADICT